MRGQDRARKELAAREAALREQFAADRDAQVCKSIQDNNSSTPEA